MANTGQFLARPLELIASLFQATPKIAVPAPLQPVASHAASSAAEALAPTAARVVAPSGLCGFIPSESGGRDFVCQAFGQVMPAVVFLASLLVVILTIAFAIRHLNRHLATARALDEACARLDRLASPAPGEWASRELVTQVIGALSAETGSRNLLPSLASRLREAVVPMGDGALAVSALRAPVAVSIGGDELVHASTGKALADALPGWLTSTGLLATFTAILLGLQNVRVLDNLEVRGIGGLVNGLSGKFFSSVAALGCALTVTLLNHFLAERIDARWSSLLRRLERLLPAATPERLLLELLQRPRS